MVFVDLVFAVELLAEHCLGVAHVDGYDPPSSLLSLRQRHSEPTLWNEFALEVLGRMPKRFEGEPWPAPEFVAAWAAWAADRMIMAQSVPTEELAIPCG